jgi:hypothetical protein
MENNTILVSILFLILILLLFVDTLCKIKTKKTENFFTHNDLSYLKNISYYKDIIFYNGKFYIEKKNINTAIINNRYKYLFKPKDIAEIGVDIKSDIIRYDKGIVILQMFWLFNIGHTLWDHIYPSWYGLFCYFNDKNVDFQYLTIDDIDYNQKKTLDIINTFSGNKPIDLQYFSKKFINKPILIPWVIAGCNDIGIACVHKNLLVKRQFINHTIDPIETFVNRIYQRYDIQRNNINNIPNKNIIYIVNKREYNGIDIVFKKLQNKFTSFSFKIIDFTKYSFKEQLKIVNNTVIYITGVGTSQFSSQFLPSGSVVIYTGNHCNNCIDFINYFDYHGLTLSKNIKALHIPYYTKTEFLGKHSSHLLEEYIIKAMKMVPVKVPVNLEHNIPKQILSFRNKVYKTPAYHDKYIKWRNEESNDINDFIRKFN